MTEDRKRALFCDTALEYLGCCEEDGSAAEIIAAYNAIASGKRGRNLNRGENWNAAFISVAADACGLADIIPATASATEAIREFKAEGRYEAAGIRPMAGDLVAFTQSPEAYSARLGIIYTIDGDRLTVIEGDADGAVDFRTFDIKDEEILGYCCPDFASAAKKQEEEK